MVVAALVVEWLVLIVNPVAQFAEFESSAGEEIVAVPLVVQADGIIGSLVAPAVVGIEPFAVHAETACHSVAEFGTLVVKPA